MIASLNVASLTAEPQPEFHNVLQKSTSMAKFLYINQIQLESKVSDGVLYERQHTGGLAEAGFAQVLQETLPKYDSRFSQGVNGYWTFQIKLARANSGSKWHSFAKSLPDGIQTIKRRRPTKWKTMANGDTWVEKWTDVKEFKVIVY